MGRAIPFLVVLIFGLGLAPWHGLVAQTLYVESPSAPATSGPESSAPMPATSESADAKSAAETAKKDEKKEEKKEAPKPSPRKKKKDGKKGYTSEDGVIKRTPEPPEDDSPELEVVPDADGKIKFVFKNEKWPVVLDFLAEWEDLSLDWTELPDDYVNLGAEKKVKAVEARSRINRSLKNTLDLLAASDEPLI